MARLHGYDGGGDRRGGFIRAYHPDEAEDVLAQWSAAVRSGMSFESKCRIRAADGSYRWFLNRAQPGRDAEGRIVRWAGSLTDIDDLIRIEESAARKREPLPPTDPNHCRSLSGPVAPTELVITSARQLCRLHRHSARRATRLRLAAATSPRRP